MRVFAAFVFPIGLMALSAPTAAADGPAESGSSRLAAYEICHPLSLLDMGEAGSESSTECVGIVRNRETDKQPDNLSIRCLEATSARPDAYKYSGACVQTDGDGDKLYMTYEGAKNGQIKWIGGTGKFEGVTGTGDLGVVVAPGNTPTQFGYTLSYSVDWKRKPK